MVQSTLAPPVTLEEFSRLPREGERYELNAGELIVSPPGKSFHTLVAHELLEILQAFLKQAGESRAFMEAGYVLGREPLTIRQPDVSVLSKDRIASTAPDSYFEGAPQLAIEIVSPSDAAEDLDFKAEQYLQAGAHEVWILYPKTKTVHVYRRAGESKILNQEDTLQSPDVMPDFSVKVADIFLMKIM